MLFMAGNSIFRRIELHFPTEIFNYRHYVLVSTSTLSLSLLTPIILTYIFRDSMLRMEI